MNWSHRALRTRKLWSDVLRPSSGQRLERVLRPLSSSLALESAARIVDEVIAVRRKHGLLPLAVAVVDAGGNLVAFKREDGCGVLRFDIAFGKAWAALGLGMPTRAIRDQLASKTAFQAAVACASDGRFIPVPGGVLILDSEGTAIGAVGISGHASDQDEFCGITAVQIAGFVSDPAEPHSQLGSPGV